ncbi:MAG: hypothetical protein IPJ41_02865 [Phycisphaerales bacterium]|nr:hypothetical protein [Phycisphaerales bacterium]
MSEVGEPTRPHRSLRALARLPLHPAVSVVLVALLVWTSNHVPRPRASGAWPPGIGRPGLHLLDGNVECRTLAWAIRDGDGWRFVISPWAGEDSAAACTVDVILQHGSFGYPFPTKTGWWGTRTIMHRRQKLSSADRSALFAAAIAFLQQRPDEPEAAFIPLLEHPDTTHLHTVPYGALRNTLFTIISVLGAVAAVRCVVFLLAVLFRLIRWLEARRETELAVRSYSCPACGYDLRGLPERRCPECGSDWAGTPAAPQAHARPSTIGPSSSAPP